MQFVILVTGSRTWTNYDFVKETLSGYGKFNEQITVRHGAARGLDTLARDAALELGFDHDPMPADWTRNGRGAGYIRNAEMLKKEPLPGVCLAFGMPCSCTVVMTPHVSHGTRHMAHIAGEAGIPVIKYRG